MPTTLRLRPVRPVPAALRGLGVLLVLLGVVAMHQLAGGTHMATTTSTLHSRAAAHAATEHHVGHRAGDPGARTTAMPPMPAPPAVDTQATGRSAVPHGGMPLCLAVLTGVALLALPAATPAVRVAPPGTPAAVRRDTSRPGRGPPRDLLAQLCVLRT